MIEINGKYSIKRGPMCWHLIENGARVRTTYHATIEQACTAIIDREAGNCLSVEELRNFFRDAVEALTKHCEEGSG